MLSTVSISADRPEVKLRGACGLDMNCFAQFAPDLIKTPRYLVKLLTVSTNSSLSTRNKASKMLTSEY